MHYAVAVSAVLTRISEKFPEVSVRELEIGEANHFERDLLIRGVRERDGAFLLATSDNDFVEDDAAAVSEMAEVAVAAIRRFGQAPASVAVSLRFERSKAANSWAPNTLHGVMLVQP